jgi:hypothetical protein
MIQAHPGEELHPRGLKHLVRRTNEHKNKANGVGVLVGGVKTSILESKATKLFTSSSKKQL